MIFFFNRPAASVEKRLMQPQEKPGEVLAQFKGEGRLKFFFLTKEGLPLPEGSWVKAKTADKNRIMSLSLEPGSPLAAALAGGSPGSPTHPGGGSRDSSSGPIPMGPGMTKPRPESVQKAGAAIIGLRERMERRMTLLKDERGNFKQGNTTLSSSPQSPGLLAAATASMSLNNTASSAAASPAPAASQPSTGFRLDENFNLDAYATVAWADLRLGKKIGEGQYGVVSKVRCLRTSHTRIILAVLSSA
jgi:hypothetical protein